MLTCSPRKLSSLPSSKTISLWLLRPSHRLVGSGRRARQVAAGSVLSALSLLFIRHLSSLPLPLAAPPDLVLQDEFPLIEPELPSKETVPSWDRTSALLGPPTNRFRGMSCLFEPPFRGNIVYSHLDNLRNDTKYMTSWTSAGWSEHPPNSLFRPLTTSIYPANNVMTYVSLFLHSPSNCLTMPRETSFTSPC